MSRPSLRTLLPLALLGGGAASAVLFSAIASATSHGNAQVLAFVQSHGPWVWPVWVVLSLAALWRLHRDAAGSVAVMSEAEQAWPVTAPWLLVGGLVALAATPLLMGRASHLLLPALAGLAAWWSLPLTERWAMRAARLRPVGGAWVLPVLAGGLVALIVFVQAYRRHLWFGSGGKDLGLFHQSVWLLSRGVAPNNTILGMSAFADHLELIDLLAAPLQWLWPDAGALLLFQSLCLGAGAAALWAWTRRRLDSPGLAWGAVVAYLALTDVQSGAMFDFNPTTCAAGLLPVMVWAYDAERRRWFIAATVLVALCKENIAFYAAGLALVLALRGGALRRLALLSSAATFALGAIGAALIIPAFGAGFRHWRFEALGKTPGEAVISLLRAPLQAFVLLFVPDRKIDGLLVPFSSLAFLPLLRPVWLLALLPMILERFWSSHANRWWGHHYGAAGAAIALCAALDVCSRWPAVRLQRALVVTVVGSAVLLGTASHLAPAPLWVWRAPYYTSEADRADAEALVAHVPAAADVAAQNHLIPHLSARAEIYEINRPIRASHVALDLAQDAWPFGHEYAGALARELLDRGYGVAFCQGQALLLVRGAGRVPCAALGLP